MLIFYVIIDLQRFCRTQTSLWRLHDLIQKFQTHFVFTEVKVPTRKTRMVPTSVILAQVAMTSVNLILIVNTDRVLRTTMKMQAIRM